MCAGVKPTLVEAGAGEVVGEGREERVLERRGDRLDAREKGRETTGGEPPPRVYVMYALNSIWIGWLAGLIGCLLGLLLGLV